jgi:hypothetical protein
MCNKKLFEIVFVKRVKYYKNIQLNQMLKILDKNKDSHFDEQ